MKSRELGSFPGEESKDVFVKKDIVYGPGVVVFDLDGLLETGEKNIWERIAARQGISDEFAGLKMQYLNKRNLDDRREWVSQEVRAYIKSRLTKGVVDEEVNSQPLDMEVKKIIPEINSRGYKTAIATGGLKALAERAKSEFGIDEIMALCDFIYDDQGLLVDWKYEPCDYDGKVNALWEIARKLRVPRSRVVYVGHGQNDKPAFNGAPLSITVANFNRRSEWAPGAMVLVESVMDITKHIPLIPRYLRKPKTSEWRTESPENLASLPSASEKFKEGVRLLVERIDKKLEEKKDGTVFVMIAGRSGSGKTEKIIEALKAKYGEELSGLSTDSYFKGNSYIKDMEGKGMGINRDHPLYVDFDLLKKHVADLAQGKAIDRPIFNYRKREKDGSESFPPNRLIVLEGIFALRPEMPNFGDRGIKVFVDVSLYGSIMRKIKRDTKKRSDSNPAQALFYYLTVGEPMYQEHIAPTRKNADLIIANEYDSLGETKKSGFLESQIKFKVVDMENMRRLLLREGASPLKGDVYQHDLYFDLEGKDSVDSDNLARIRYEDDVKVNEGRRYCFILQGPRTDRGTGISQSTEIKIDNEMYNAIFDKYINGGVTIAKRREAYSYDGIILNLDSGVIEAYGKGEEVRILLGDFLELRTAGSPDEAKMKNICNKLGIPYGDRIIDSYVDLEK